MARTAKANKEKLINKILSEETDMPESMKNMSMEDMKEMMKNMMMKMMNMKDMDMDSIKDMMMKMSSMMNMDNDNDMDDMNMENMKMMMKNMMMKMTDMDMDMDEVKMMMKNMMEMTDMDPDNMVSETDPSFENKLSIEPHGETPMSKMELIQKMVTSAIKMEPEELSNFVARLGVPDDIVSDNDTNYENNTQYAREAGNDLENKASINSANRPGDDVSRSLMPTNEDFKIIFGNKKELAEEFYDKTSTLFETTLNTRLGVEREMIKEEYEKKLEEEIEKVSKVFEDAIDKYLSYTATKWLEENQLAVESGIKTELSESFLTGLKTLFETHYVDIPDAKVDVVETLSKEMSKLNENYNTLVEENISLKNSISKKNKETNVSTLSEGLTEIQKDKFRDLLNNINYKNDEEFYNKAKIIKESFFGKSTVKHNDKDETFTKLNETFDGGVSENVESESDIFNDPIVNLVAKSLEKTSKKY